MLPGFRTLFLIGFAISVFTLPHLHAEEVGLLKGSEALSRAQDSKSELQQKESLRKYFSHRAELLADNGAPARQGREAEVNFLFVDQFGDPVPGIKMWIVSRSFSSFNFDFRPEFIKKIQRFINSRNSTREAPSLFVFSDAQGRARVPVTGGFDLQSVTKKGYEIDASYVTFYSQDAGSIKSPIRWTRDKPFIVPVWKITSPAESLDEVPGEFFYFSEPGKACRVHLGKVLEKIDPKPVTRPTLTVYRPGKVVNICGENQSGDFDVIAYPGTFSGGEMDTTWSFELRSVDGAALFESDEIYMNEAPESGYQKVWNISVDDLDSSREWDFSRKFYLKRANGTYAKIEIVFMPYYKGGSAISTYMWLNPSGSRNLRIDKVVPEVPEQYRHLTFDSSGKIKAVQTTEPEADVVVSKVVEKPRWEVLGGVALIIGYLIYRRRKLR